MTQLGYNPEAPSIPDFSQKETPAKRQERIEEELLKNPPLPRTPKRLQKEDSGESLGEIIDRSSRNRYSIRYRNNNNFNNHP